MDRSLLGCVSLISERNREIPLQQTPESAEVQSCLKVVQITFSLV